MFRSRRTWLEDWKVEFHMSRSIRPSISPPATIWSSSQSVIYCTEVLQRICSTENDILSSRSHNEDTWGKLRRANSRRSGQLFLSWICDVSLAPALHKGLTEGRRLNLRHAELQSGEPKRWKLFLINYIQIQAPKERYHSTTRTSWSSAILYMLLTHAHQNPTISVRYSARRYWFHMAPIPQSTMHRSISHVRSILDCCTMIYRLRVPTRMMHLWQKWVAA